MDPQTALEHLLARRFVKPDELVHALAQALTERDQARAERDTLAAKVHTEPQWGRS